MDDKFNNQSDSLCSATNSSLGRAGSEAKAELEDYDSTSAVREDGASASGSRRSALAEKG